MKHLDSNHLNKLFKEYRKTVWYFSKKSALNITWIPPTSGSWFIVGARTILALPDIFTFLFRYKLMGS